MAAVEAVLLGGGVSTGVGSLTLLTMMLLLVVRRCLLYLVILMLLLAGDNVFLVLYTALTSVQIKRTGL